MPTATKRMDVETLASQLQQLKQLPPDVKELLDAKGDVQGAVGAAILKMLVGKPNATEYHQVDIARGAKGNGQIILPEQMTLDEGITWLTRKRDAEEKEVQIREEIIGFPLDAAHALGLAVRERYGFQEVKKIPGETFFDPDTPPLFITVPIDHTGKTKEIFVGRFKTPMVEGHMELSPNRNDSLFITGTVRQKSVPEVKELAALTRKKLAEQSLYRGKAVKIDFSQMERKLVMPQFWDTALGRESLLLNKAVEAQVRASIWNLIKYADRCQALGISLKRTALMEGNYGTGKTLCANITARIATENGWTFIYVANADQLATAYEFAKRYQPAVVFAEDVDRAAEKGEEAFVGQLSTVLDGVDSKQAQVLVILTTNHVENIPPVLLRPGGRCDAAIHFAEPDEDTAGRLVQHYAIDATTGQSVLDLKCDIGAIGKRLNGKIPAIIREVVERAKLYAIDRDPLRITTEELMMTADMMDHHAKLCQPQEAKPSTAERLADAFGALVEDSTEAVLKEAGVIET